MTVQQSNSEPTELDAGLTDEYCHWREQAKLIWPSFLKGRIKNIENRVTTVRKSLENEKEKKEVRETIKEKVMDKEDRNI